MNFPSSPLSDSESSPSPVRMSLRRPPEGGRGEISSNQRSSSCSVLTVGISVENRREIEGALKGTDFACKLAPGLNGALAVMARDKTIGVVVVDQEAISRPVSDLALNLRQHAERPVTIVLMVRELTFELAEILLETGITGIIGFPLSSENIVRVVTAAANAYRDEIGREDGIATAFHIIKEAMSRNDVLGCSSARTGDRTASLSKRPSEHLASNVEDAIPLRRSAPSVKSIKAIHGFFREIGTMLGFVNVDNAAWLMLIDLFLIEAEGCQIGVTALCTGVGVPVTTALKRLDELSAANLVERIPDEIDKRRIFVCLTKRGRECVMSMIERLEQTLTTTSFIPDFVEGTQQWRRPSRSALDKAVR